MVSLRIVPLMVCTILLSCAIVPFASLGAQWSVDEDPEFGGVGHVSDGVEVTGDSLTLASESKTYLQKDWTGNPGQAEWLDATSYLTAKAVDGSSAGTLSLGKERWTRLGDAPATRTEHVAVWDPSRNSMVVFGGSRNGTQALDDAYRYEPLSDTWTALSTASAGRYWHSGAWDGHKNEVVVHGGMVRSGASLKSVNDTWALNTASDSWSERANGTLKRYGHTAVWDPVRVRILVFGGYAGSALSNELWSYDPISDAWEKKTSAPVGLYEHSAVWAEGMDRMYVFGGLKGGGSASKDLWSYDAVNDTWVQYGTGATARSGHSAAWDPEDGVMIVVGGHSGATNFNDTWTYDPEMGQWRRGKDLPAQPRTGHTLTWSTVFDMAILHGGKGEDGELSETWGFSPSYIKSGELVSSAFDMSEASGLANVSWKMTESTPGCVGSSFKLQLAGSDTLDQGSFLFAGPSGSSSYYEDGEAIDKGLFGERYLRYKVFLSTSNVACSPVLEEVRVNYRSYLMAGNYTSPVFDTGSNDPNFLKMEYEYDNPGGTEIWVHFRSSYLDDMTSSSEWEEIDPSDGSISTPGRRYVQFWVEMRSTIPAKVPTLESFKLTYNSMPHLISFPVEPLVGPSDTEFVFKVTYKDGDGESPITFQVYIDGDPHDMEPQEYNYKKGANFTYKAKLSSGMHKFMFKFSDGINTTLEPATGEFDGPLVNDLPVASLKGPGKAVKGKKVKFDASASTDGDGTVIQYKFDFGDGEDSGWVNSSSVKHAFKKKGKFTVKVYVKDDLGGVTVSSESEIKVEEEGAGSVPGPGGAVTAVALVVATSLLSLGRRRKRIYGKI